MKAYNHLITYISKEYKNFIFISIFYSLWLASKYASSFNHELTSFSGRMIGTATLQGYDIGARIAVFYKSGLLFFCSLLLLSILAKVIHSVTEKFFNSEEIKIINYTSLGGIVLYFFTFWSSSIQVSFELIYCIQKVVLIAFALKLFLLKYNPSLQLSVSFYAFVFVLALSFYFIWNEIAVLFGIVPIVNILTFLFLASVVSVTSTLLYLKKSTDVKNKINKISFLLIPIAFIPLLSFLKDEIYLIFNKHQILSFTPQRLYVLGLLIIAAIVLIRYWKNKKNVVSLKNIDQLIATRYFPLMIVSIATYVYYLPFIQLSTEMFEAGNRFLPIMEFQKFGVVPVFEKFNSHALSELFFASLYTFLNGMHSREMLIYDFIPQVIWAILGYYFIYKLLRNAYIALFITLFFPLSEYLLPDYHLIALVSIFVLYKLIQEKASVKNYSLFIFCLLFLIVWRIDIGYASVIAMSLTLFIFWLNQKRFVFSTKILVKSILLFTLIAAFFLLGISWYRGINVFSEALNALNYLSSTQTYGLTTIGNETLNEYKVQYYIFPVLILFMVAAAVLFFQKYTISKSQRFVFCSFVFLAFYYFVNFQRGLVRHSFIEGHDNGLSSFLFLILSASIYLFFHSKAQVVKFLLFISLATFLIMNYKFPAVNAVENMYSKMETKTKQFSTIEPKIYLSRCIDSNSFENKKYGAFKKFIANELNEQQTFIDFSNTPMLYYFTGKITSSYFYQTPLSVHNDFLQENFVSDLKNYDAPFLVFSSFPEIYWDKVDGVPNKLRHYKMAEHFYNNYSPYVIVDSLCIWKRNDFEKNNHEREIYSISSKKDSTAVIKGEINMKGNKQCLLKLKCFTGNNTTPSIAIINFDKKTVLQPLFFDDINNINYYKTESNSFSFEISNNNMIDYFKIIECDYISDFYSAVPCNFNINKLAYIWGTYDKKVHEEKVILDLTSKPDTLKKDAFHYYNFKKTIDKTTGNTILITIGSTNDTLIPVDLLYGSSTAGYKGTFSFVIPAGKGERKFAVRISSQHNWYDSTIDYIALVQKTDVTITLNKIQLLKGN